MALLDEVKTEPPATAFNAAFADHSSGGCDIHSNNDDSNSFKMTSADSAVAEMKATPVASPPRPQRPPRGETEMAPLLTPAMGTAHIKREARSPSPARTMVANGTLKQQEMTR